MLRWITLNNAECVSARTPPRRVAQIYYKPSARQQDSVRSIHILNIIILYFRG